MAKYKTVSMEHRVALRLSDSMNSKLLRACEINCANRGAIIRTALIEYFEKHGITDSEGK